ncbi:hypothetical protein [Bizionia arctica]|uniref:Uncharacterized protein n=1 Tax=Bizionia arctica TaxID=1495645 RepID=A0A917GR00_9FLAO|nr:hypothetical protein [Bizionia arctica]GGG53891.1 hypothetical protein GCM10010976_26080 [Bizionia arctica]
MKFNLNTYFDFKIGIAGALFMGTTVFAINYFSTNLVLESLTAALKQGTYTFLFGGFLMKGCEYIAIHIKKRNFAIVAAVLIPTVTTLILTYGMHLLKGTPKPLASTIPTLMIIPATAVWAIRKRKMMNKEEVPRE